MRRTVRDAVRRRLVSDVPLGALLSGGIDSTIVVGLMAEASTQPVRTFTVGVDDQRYDERSTARIAASAFGTKHEELLVEPDPVELVSQLTSFLDEPLGDEAILPTFLISQVARRHVTVALTGDGGDESFAGYERYAAMRMAERIGAVPLLPSLGARALRALPAGRRQPRSTPFRAARLLEAAARPARERYGTLMEIFPADLRAELYAPSLAAALGPPRPAWELLGGAPAAGTSGLQRLDARTYLPDDLLVKADRASMATSLELRSPLLDHEVLELGVSLPDSLRFEGRRGKVALRRAFADLIPPELAARGKTGFGIPLGDWFRGPLRELAGDTLLDARARAREQLRPNVVERLLHEHTRGERDHGHRLWCLLVLELWQRSWLDAAVPTASRAAVPMTRRRAAAIVLAAAVVPRLVVLLSERGAILEELVEKSDRFAQTLVASGTFGFLPGRPSGYTQPLYAWFLAGLYQVFERHWLVVGIAHIALAALTAVVVLEIGRRAVSLRVGVVGATIATLHPFLVWHDMHLNREILDGLLIAVVALLALVVAERKGALLALALGAAAGSRSSETRASRCSRSCLAAFVALPARALEALSAARSRGPRRRGPRRHALDRRATR